MQPRRDGRAAHPYPQRSEEHPNRDRAGGRVDRLPKERVFLIALDKSITFVLDPWDTSDLHRARARRLARQRLRVRSVCLCSSRMPSSARCVSPCAARSSTPFTSSLTPENRCAEGEQRIRQLQVPSCGWRRVNRGHRTGLVTEIVGELLAESVSPMLERGSKRWVVEPRLRGGQLTAQPVIYMPRITRRTTSSDCVARGLPPQSMDSVFSPP